MYYDPGISIGFAGNPDRGCLHLNVEYEGCNAFAKCWECIISAGNSTGLAGNLDRGYLRLYVG